MYTYVIICQYETKKHELPSDLLLTTSSCLQGVLSWAPEHTGDQ